MSFKDWLETASESIDKWGIRKGCTFSLNELYIGGLRRFGRFWNYGTSVYEKEWDVLLILDACRPDALMQLSDEYAFLPDVVNTHTSPGSQSKEWMDKTFTDEHSSEVSQTAYITANVFTQSIDHDQFSYLDEVWQYASSDRRGTVPPRPVTDSAVDALRRKDYERTIVHYYQPHQPYRMMEDIGQMSFDLTHSTIPDSAFTRLQQGQLSFDEVWEAYLDNTRWVLDNVEIFLRSVDADNVVISADHGEAFGEWWCYEHPEYVPIPVLKTVPWIETTATNDGTYTPAEQQKDTEMEKESVEQLLYNLGYL